MSFVNCIKYEDRNGEIMDEKTEQAWKIEKIHIDFDCPVCSHNNNCIVEGNIKNSSRYTCVSCGNRFFLYPKNGALIGKKVRDMSDREKLETQFKSINKTYDIIEDYPMMTTRTVHHPDNMFIGFMAVIFATLSAIVTFISINDLLFNSRIVLTYYILLIVASILGTVTIALGSGRYLYNNYKVYNESDFEGSFYLYIMCMANYYHSLPFETFRFR